MAADAGAGQPDLAVGVEAAGEVQAALDEDPARVQGGLVGCRGDPRAAEVQVAGEAGAEQAHGAGGRERLRALRGAGRAEGRLAGDGERVAVQRDPAVAVEYRPGQQQGTSDVRAGDAHLAEGAQPLGHQAAPDAHAAGVERLPVRGRVGQLRVDERHLPADLRVDQAERSGDPGAVGEQAAVDVGAVGVDGAPVLSGDHGVAQVECAAYPGSVRAQQGQPGAFEVDRLGGGVGQVDRLVEAAAAQQQERGDLPVVHAQAAGDACSGDPDGGHRSRGGRTGAEQQGGYHLAAHGAVGGPPVGVRRIVHGLVAGAQIDELAVAEGPPDPAFGGGEPAEPARWRGGVREGGPAAHAAILP